MDSSYWMFDLIIPLMMILPGYLLHKHPPKGINYMLGYRTKRSMSSQENWIYANKRMGKLWFKWGWVLIALVLIIRVIIPVQSEFVSSIVIYGSLIYMMLPIIIVEKELKNMKKEG